MWRDPAYLLDMLNSVRKVLEYASNLDRAAFMASTLGQDAILRRLTILGEAANRVSQEFRADHPEIPWRRITGFRNVVVHDYFGVNFDEVWHIVQHDVPRLIDLLEPLVPPEQP